MSAATATDMTFACPSVTAPPDARPYYDTAPMGVARTAWDEVYAWFDASCVVSCTSEWMDATCESASCVTAAGATLVWEEQYREEGGGHDTYTETTTRTLEVIPPASAGLAWTSATIEWWEESSSSSFEYGSQDSATLSWTGSLQADWPADGWFEAGTRTSGYSYSSYSVETSNWDWSSDGCDWAVQDYWNIDSGTAIDVTVNTDPLVEVISSYEYWDHAACDSEAFGTWRGYTDGVLYGNVDETTWERSGDADGDGFSTDDCDDTDAAVNPCAADVALDGVDSNCDGGEDADGDGGVSLAE
ncbi:MAG: MopE-related protein, partial [Actinomycetota bacterium]|nr:MopE-related protein [Actinomycetota bacterium]